MWIDKGIYWAWVGSGHATCHPPHRKELVYASVTDSTGLRSKLCVAVLERGGVTKVNREKVAWMRENGFRVEIPAEVE